MSRRRTERNEERDAFLDLFPELQTFETNLSVVAPPPPPDNGGPINGEDDGGFEALGGGKGGGKKRGPQIEAVDDEGNELPVELLGRDGVKGVGTFTDAVLLSDALLFAIPELPGEDIEFDTRDGFGTQDYGPGPGPFPFPIDLLTPSKISLTDEGFGIAADIDSDGDFDDSSVQALGGGGKKKGPPLDVGPGDTTIGDGEAMVFVFGGIFGGPVDGPGFPIGPNIQEVDGPVAQEFEFFDFDTGGKSVTIDFDVISGSGTVLMGGFDIFGVGEDFEESVTTAESEVLGGRTNAGSLELEVMGDGAFELAGFTTTGDLEIVVTGIQYTTNFDSGGFPTT